MKKILALAALLFVPALAVADTYRINPFTGKLDRVGTGSGGVGGSTLTVQMGDVTVESATVLDFSSYTHVVSSSPAGEANVGLNPSSVTLQGNTFNGANQLLQADSNGLIPNADLDSSSVTKQGNTFNGASQLIQADSNGLVPNADLDSSSVTKQGNTFNGANQLIQADSGGLVPNADLDPSSVTKLGPSIDLSGAEATGTLAAARFPALTGDVTTSAGNLATTIADNSVDGTDIALGSDAAGDIMYYDGTNWVRLPKGTAGQVLEMNAGATAPEWDTDDSGSGLSNPANAALNMAGYPVINVGSMTYANTGVSSVDTSTNPYLQVISSGTSHYIYPTKFILAGSTVVGRDTTDTLTNKTMNVDSNVLNFTQKWEFAAPTDVQGTTVTFWTSSGAFSFGQANFDAGVSSQTNWAMYGPVIVPANIDTSRAATADFMFRLGGADTGTHRYVISWEQVAASAGPSGPGSATGVNADFAGDGSGASGDLEMITGTALTNFASSLVAGRAVYFYVCREGDTSDTSTVRSRSGAFAVTFGVTQ